MKTLSAREAKDDMRFEGGGGCGHHTASIDPLCREIAAGRRKLLVEMAGYAAMYRP
jgi:hypothetical protein